MNSTKNKSDQPTLKYEQEGEAGIQTSYAIIVCRAGTCARVTQVTAGNFDCTPYESDQLLWGFAAELHLLNNKWWLRVFDLASVTKVENGDWVTRNNVTRRLFVEHSTDSTWCPVDEDSSATVDEPPDEARSLGEPTKVDRVELNWRHSE